jgi:hypothetical protein
MSKKTMQELKDMLCLQLDDLKADAKKRGDITPTLLDAIHKVTDTIKNIDKIEMLSEDDDYSGARGRRYSRDGEWEAYGEYSDRNGRDMMMRSRDSYDSSDNGNSYRRHYVRGHYSRDDARKEMMEELHEAMHKAETEKEKEIIRRTIENLEKM